MQIFAALTKVDEASRTVSGVIANEALDRSGEVFDYESSKPLFEAWSGNFAKATDGKSVGNVRAMHGNVAAGVLKALNMDDAAKAITVDAKIVDDNEWAKVQQGVYTGFSIGGKYARKWQDGDVNRYTAEPYEVSLVDLPCNPDAMFTVIKADGAQEMRKFAVFDDEALAKWVDEHADAIEKIKRRKDVNPKEGEHKYGDVKFADEKNKKYPIDTPEHIRAAWNYINKPKNAAKYDAADVKAIKAKIVAAWKEKIDKAGPPSAEKYALDALAKSARMQDAAKAVAPLIGMGDPLEKGLYAVAQLAQMLDCLACMADGVDAEADAEGDESELPTQFRAALQPLARVFLAMAQEETEEAMKGELNDDAAVANAADGDLQKAARKNSHAARAHHKAIREHLKGASDHLDALEANDPPADDGSDDAAEKLAKAAGEVAKRDALLTKAAERIDALTALVEKLKAEPAPVKAALRVVSKGQDIGNPDDKTIEPVRKADGSVDEVRTALKKALSEPVMVR